MPRSTRRPYWPRYFLVHDSGFPAHAKDAGTLKRARDIYHAAGWHTTIIGPVGSREEAMKRARPWWDKLRAAERALADRAEALMAAKKESAS
jgi:hypothetical protein